MIKVFEVLLDDRCRILHTDADTQRYPFDGTPMEDDWRAPDVYVLHPKLKKPDIWSLFLMAFAYEEKTLEFLGRILEQTGELLTLPFDGRELTVHNVTNVIDCLDSTKTAHYAGTQIIKTYAFRATRFEYSLFKIPQLPLTLFAVDGLAGPDDEFKAIVEAKKLKGVRFKELWQYCSARNLHNKFAPARFVHHHCG